MRTNDQIMQGGEKVSHMHFPVIWTLNLKILGKTLEKQSLPVYRIMDQIVDLSLVLNWVIDILFETLTLQIENWI